MSISGDRGDEVDRDELTEVISRMTLGQVLVAAEFTADGVTRSEVWIDRCGTPRIFDDPKEWADFGHGDSLDEPALIRFLGPTEASLLVAWSPEGARGRDAERAWRFVFRCYPNARPVALANALSVGELLDMSTAVVPLSQWYELVVLEHRRSGRLSRAWEQLFKPGAVRGASHTFQVRCEPSGPAGTSFAVMARTGARPSGLVSMASAQFPAGTYTVKAVLRRPGMVAFEGLPSPLHRDSRKWADVQDTVPSRLGSFGPAHLIIAVETCGSDDQVAAHLDRAGQLIRNVEHEAEGPVRYSLIEYGAHPHDDMLDDDPVTVLAWADRAEAVVAHLPVLAERARARHHPYTRAASIECMLAEVARLLPARPRRPEDDYAAGRPVLVTVGSRGAFPAYRDPLSEVLPCPRRHDWESFYRWLTEDHPQLTFGAICGGNGDAEVWRLLGREASAELLVGDAREFAADLKLLRPAAQHIPFPIIVR